jgi:hypothetical protein
MATDDERCYGTAAGERHLSTSGLNRFSWKLSVPQGHVNHDLPAFRYVHPEASSFNFQDIFGVAQDPVA